MKERMTKDELINIFSERLKKLRDEHGLNTRALGEIIGTSNATISRYETGKRCPDLILVAKIAQYFDVSIGYLCGLTINQNEETLLMLYNNLSEDYKVDAIKYISNLPKQKNNL